MVSVSGPVLLSAILFSGSLAAQVSEAAGVFRSYSADLKSKWRDPDEGIWGVRGGRRHSTHSNLVAWSTGCLPGAALVCWRKDRSVSREVSPARHRAAAAFVCG